MTSPTSTNAILIGHSLVGKDMPTMLNGMNEDLGHTGNFDYQVIIGSPLKFNWENGHQDFVEGVNAREALTTGEYGVLVMTEAVPLDPHIEWSDPAGNALNYLNVAYDANPDVQSYFYATWHGFDFYEGDLAAWREGLDAFSPKWEGIVDDVNAGRPEGSKEMLLIPADQAMANLYDAIEAGEVPGVDNIRYFFQDDIHLNAFGLQFISGVHHTTIYGTNPEDLPTVMKGEYGNYPSPPQDVIDAMHKVILETALEYDRDGVDADDIGVDAPVDPTPVDPTPVDPTPVDPTPVDPTPVDPEEPPVDPEPVDPEPVDPPAPGTKVEGFKASYWAIPEGTSFAEMDFSAEPDQEGVVGSIDYMREGAMWDGGPVDNFAAKFEGNINIQEGGEYQLIVASAGPAVFYLNGEVIMDRSTATSFEMIEITADLSAGEHAFEVRYLENEGITDLYVGYRGADTNGNHDFLDGAAVSHFAGDAPVEPEEPVDPPVDPVDPTPVDPTPVDPEPVDPETPPVDPTPVDPEPVDPETPPVDPTPVDPEPVDPETPPVDPTPVDPEEPPLQPVDPPVGPDEPPLEPVDPPTDPVDPVDPTPVDPEPVDPPVVPVDPPVTPEEPEDDEDPQDEDTAGGGGCFVATAAYGDRMAPDVVSLRHFRDHHLIKTKAGRAFVRTYWIVGPKMAQRVSSEGQTGRVLRGVLSRCVSVLRACGVASK